MTAVAHVRGRTLHDIAWPLLVIIAVQAALSTRLIWSNTAFQDEALYLWAGHLEFAHWFYGTRVPAFAAYFSGAPVIYPVLGAIADTIGGLAAARMLSLVFMLGATALLWGTTSRMYGRRAAFVAAALWSLLGPVIRLGAFATYDAMSLFLVAFAAWCATSRRGQQNATLPILAAAAALALANATKYASVIFDPAVIALAVAAGWPEPGGKHAWRRGALLFYWVVVATIVELQFGQGEYLAGVDQTTLLRPGGASSVSTIFGSSVSWIGLLVLLAAVTAVAALWDRANRLIIGMLLATGLLPTLWQARIHTMTSLNKHVAFGAWFAAIAVGYGGDRAYAWLRSRPRIQLRVPVAVSIPLALIPLAAFGMHQAEGFFAWPGVGNLVPVLRAAATPGARYLADTPPSLQYYLPGTTWHQWTSLTGDPSQAQAALRQHGYKLVILDDTDQANDITASGYRQVATVPYSGPDHRGSYRILEYVARG